MRDLFLNTYLQECTSRYTALGFVRTRQTYARIQNDVLQTFTLKRLRMGYSGTIEFGIYPLCMETLFVDMGLYSLEQFDIGQYTKGNGWCYDRLSPESVKACINDMLDTVDKYLLPLFSRANSSASALTELIRLDELFEKNRLAITHQSVQENCAGVLSLMFPEKYYMALKSGNYAFAKKYLMFQIAMKEKKNNQHFLTAPLDNIPPKSEKRLLSLKEHLLMIENGNMAFFSNMLKQNEHRNLENLRNSKGKK